MNAMIKIEYAAATYGLVFFISTNIYLIYLQGGPKKSVFSKNENRPWWGFFEKKIHDQ